jgi:hypothetical protein
MLLNMSEIVLIVHFIIVLFFITGFFAGLIWNQSVFRYIHAGSLGGITLLMMLSSFWWHRIKS